MKKNLTMPFALLCLLFAAISPSWAGTIEVKEPWVREGPPTARVLGGFMVISNQADKDDALISASSPDFNMIELHKTEIVDGVGKMIPQERITVPAGGEVELKSGSYHLMLMMAKRSLKEGDSIQVELQFESGSINIDMPIRKGEGMMMHHKH